MSVNVVRLNSRRNNFTTYVGRTCGDMIPSPFHNPFHIGADGTREEVVEKFAAYWYANEQRHLRELALIVITEDETLGCWCKPAACHGDIIAGYLNWKREDCQQCLY